MRLASIVFDLALVAWRSLCPEGTTGLSLGFNPRNQQKQDRPKGAEESFGIKTFQRFKCMRHGILRPFRAPRDIGLYLGLKPQAESYSPFGTKTVHENRFHFCSQSLCPL